MYSRSSAWAPSSLKGDGALSNAARSAASHCARSTVVRSLAQLGPAPYRLSITSAPSRASSAMKRWRSVG